MLRYSFRCINALPRWIVVVILAMHLFSSSSLTAQQGEFRIVDSVASDEFLAGGWHWSYTDVQCVNDQICVALLERPAGMYSVALRKSIDGGESWSTALFQQNSYDPLVGEGWQNDGVRIHDFALMNSQEWLVVGDTVYGRYDYTVSPARKLHLVHPFILRTSNGGDSWTTVLLTDSLYGFQSISMYDNNFGIAVATDSIFQTSDGGRTWRVFNKPPGSMGDVIDNIYIDSPGDFRTLLYARDIKQNQIVSTSDGGATWTRETLTSIIPNRNRIFFLSASLGWSAEADAGSDMFHLRNVLKKTTDGGRTWQPKWEQEHIRPTGLIRVAFLDSANGFAGGHGGQFMHTRNGGESWQLYDSLFIEDVVVRGEDPAVYGIAPLSPTSALIAFSTTRLVKYTAAPASAPQETTNGKRKSRLLLQGPSNDGALRVRVVDGDMGELRLVDALGQLLLVLDVPPTNIVTLDVANLSNGTYFLVMVGNDGLVVERFIR